MSSEVEVSVKTLPKCPVCGKPVVDPAEAAAILEEKDPSQLEMWPEAGDGGVHKSLRGGEASGASHSR